MNHHACVFLCSFFPLYRWTPAFKEVVRESRVDKTRLLSSCIAQAAKPPKVFVSLSGVGEYIGVFIDKDKILISSKLVVNAECSFHLSVQCACLRLSIQDLRLRFCVCNFYSIDKLQFISIF